MEMKEEEKNINYYYIKVNKLNWWKKQKKKHKI